MISNDVLIALKKMIVIPTLKHEFQIVIFVLNMIFTSNVNMINELFLLDILTKEKILPDLIYQVDKHKLY